MVSGWLGMFDEINGYFVQLNVSSDSLVKIIHSHLRQVCVIEENLES